jgi:hypothetical protein
VRVRPAGAIGQTFSGALGLTCAAAGCICAGRLAALQCSVVAAVERSPLSPLKTAASARY